MKLFLGKAHKILRKDYFRIMLVFSLFFLLFNLIYFSIDRFVSLDDHFFHIRFAEIIRGEGLDAFKNFHWLYFSNISLNQTYFIYYNFLFYLALIPFTFITPLFLGIKLYAAFFVSVSFATLYFFLLKVKEKNAFLWVALLLAIINHGSILRFLLTRPYALAPALLILELYFLYRRKYLGIFILSFFYLFWHSVTFFFPLVVAAIYFAFDAFYNDNRPDWKIVASSLLGVVLALLSLNFFAPGLFFYIRDIIFGVFNETIIGKKVNIAEGVELYPVNFINFIKSNTLIVSMLMVAVVFEIQRYIREKKEDIKDDTTEYNVEEKNKRPLKGTLFLLSIGFLLGTFLSQRNGDFFVFFSAAYIVMSFNYLFSYIEVNHVLVKKSLVTGIIITVVYLFSANMLFIYDQIASSGPYDAIEGTAVWLKNNTEKNTVVFNASWNWFPVLFYYNQDNYYIAGIEPRFLYDYSHEMYWNWWHISNDGYVCVQEKCDEINSQKQYSLKNDDRKKVWYEKQGDQVADTIVNDFKSDYIVTSAELKQFNDLMSNNNRFEKVFTDSLYNQYFIYRVK
ncbi:MAG: hypothetical protein QG620_602 [Patescibacteria group bacterium]|nr:hypothetical protein [Patescibacteria group bacterium]